MAGIGAQVVIDSLRLEGVDHVFGLPGTTVMELIDSLGSTEEIRYIAVRHEQVAAFMADGYARGTGKPGVCLASRGPGAANLSIGVHNAHVESVPVLALVGQVSDGFVYRDAFEEMDLLTFFEPITKWGVEIHQPARIAELVRRAYRTASAGRPGGVLVSVPHNVLNASVETEESRPGWRGRHPAANSVDIQESDQLLASSKAPVMILGGGVDSHGPEIHGLAERLASPVVTSWLRKGVYRNGATEFLGSLGYGALDVTAQAVEQADVVLALGTKFSEFTTNKWSLLNSAQKLIHVDLDPEVLGRVYVPQVGIVADATTAAESLTMALPETPPESRRERLLALRARYDAEIALPERAPATTPVSSHAIFQGLQEYVRHPGNVLVSDAPGFGTWILRYMEFDHPDSYYGAGGGSMGWGFPAAMGLKVARPDATVVVVSGDGSFWMVAQDLETAVREDIPLVVVVTNNFSFGNTRDRQRFAFGERYNGVFYANPDFAEFARMMGAYGERVERDEDFSPALARAIASGRPAVIDVIQDRMEGLPPGLVPPGVPQTRAADAS